MDDNKNIKTELANILTKIMKDKIYGSVEIYFEAGHMTQITQRIINKINHKKDQISKKISIGVSFSRQKVTSKSVPSQKNPNSDTDISATNNY